MWDLEDGPQDLVALLALVRSVLGIFHLVTELKKGVFDVVEASWWGLAHAWRTHWRHVGPF
jgi:hypothetical protein